MGRFVIKQAMKHRKKKKDKRSWKRKSIIPLILYLLIPGVVLISVVGMVFNAVEGEENDITLEAFITNSGPSSSGGYDVITKDEFADAREAITENRIVAPPPTTVFNAPIAANITFNGSSSEEATSVNRKIYQIVAKYMSPSIVKNIPKEYADPFIIMAMTNVETGGWNDVDKYYVAAIPTKYISDQITPSLVETYGIAMALKNDAFWSVKGTGAKNYQGALQISNDYGVFSPAIPADLVGSEITRSQMTLQDRYGGALSSKQWKPAVPNAGDRFSYPDSVNRTVGHLDMVYGNYNKSSSIQKDGDRAIDNRYALAAFISMGHNTGESVIYSKDSSSNKFWPRGVYVSRKWAHALGREDVINLISSKTKAMVESYRANGNKGLSNRPNSLVDEVYEYCFSKGYISREELMASPKEKRDYPVLTLINYTMLEHLYQGG